ncbi:hypothetical protein E1295_47340 [Nonomuraea mesophila]|uniref:Transposase IS110-like N-terminal domain-containing protein n=1 Tax=Nonomuraea mesophila TaxID=2530382 RepID=A0A4R5E1Y1_9ACTN|nr:transposase [Nonomuraea mesophila]TDE20084.1 hypothetical protein E1295_47340 [Nonomuraea mesophila]
MQSDAAGYAHLIRWATEHAPGPNMVWAIEGTRSHGAGLARVLRATGQQVIESDRPRRVRRRGSGKSDALDAHGATREALGREQRAIPRADGPREATRMLLVTRESAISARSSAVNQLKALLLTASEPLRHTRSEAPSLDRRLPALAPFLSHRRRRAHPPHP